MTSTSTNKRENTPLYGLSCDNSTTNVMPIATAHAYHCPASLWLHDQKYDRYVPLFEEAGIQSLEELSRVTQGHLIKWGVQEIPAEVLSEKIATIGTASLDQKTSCSGETKDCNECTSAFTSVSKLQIQGVQGGALVHERIIYGMGNQPPVSYDTDYALICSVYCPFGYGVPAKNPNTIRRYRLYAIYSDSMTDSGEHTITFNVGNWGNSSKQVSFTLARTWGTFSAGPKDYNRDAYSSWLSEEEVEGAHHGKVYGKVKGTGTQKGILRYLTLQSWDFQITDDAVKTETSSIKEEDSKEN